MNRLYSSLLRAHHAENRQMAFLAGPRQVGKTTVCRTAFPRAAYFNWDDQDHRALLLKGPHAVANAAGLDRLSAGSKDVVFDEIHKYSRWKTLLKGFFDVYGERVRITVTGSSRLDVYRAGGDSLMGRYFLYRMHPLSVGELSEPLVPSRSLLRAPRRLAAGRFRGLVDFGGFPEPFLRRDKRFLNRWRLSRWRQTFKEDARDLSRVQETDQLQVLANILRAQSGGLTNYSRLAEAVRVSVDTIRRWISVLNALYVTFTVRPWSRNVRRSLIKEPKIFLWDWSLAEEEGARAENFVACHLLKSVQLWQDMGLGEFELRFLRDKDGREVDFVVVRDGKPWFLVEVKASQNRPLSPNLAYFQSQLKTPHAFQVALDMPFIATDVFKEHRPVIVPAETLLSQIL